MKDLIKKFKKFNIYEIDEFEYIKYPDDFYNKLLFYVETSNNMYLSTMYFGNGEKTSKILNLIATRNSKNKYSKVFIDKNRGKNKNLENIIKTKNLYNIFDFKDISYKYIPTKFKEILNVYHTKLFIFDDKIILSGANIDDSYFENRLDRYFEIKNKQLADDLINKTKACVNLYKFKQNKNYLFFFDQLEELFIVQTLLCEDFDSIYICSAYFNLPKKYFKILKNKKNVFFIVNSPENNKFNNMGIMSSLITKVYEYSAYYAIKICTKAKLFEFTMNGYSMHKKGIWAFKENFCVTIIGSTNLNRRSTERDEEHNFFILSSNNKTIKMFKNEIREILKNSIERKLTFFKFKKWEFITILIFYLFNFLF